MDQILTFILLLNYWYIGRSRKQLREKCLDGKTTAYHPLLLSLFFILRTCVILQKHFHRLHWENIIYCKPKQAVYEDM